MQNIMNLLSTWKNGRELCQEKEAYGEKIKK